VDVIPYSIDTGVFSPGEKAPARQELGVPVEGTYLLFVADNVGEKRKGMRFLLEALQALMADRDSRDVLEKNGFAILCLGRPSGELEQFPIKVHSLGFINNDQKVAQAYTASDFFALPSLEDNLPNTVMEALACGRPVVAFHAGGVPEVVRHERNGLLAPAGDSAALARNILTLVSSSGLRTRFGATGRELTLDHYKYEKQAAAYMQLYKGLHQARSSSNPGRVDTSAVSLTPASFRLRQILYGGLPPGALDHLYAQEMDRRAHLATVEQQSAYIKDLETLSEDRRQQIKWLLRQRSVKLLRKTKILKFEEK
jgi:hypothetical protein